MEWPLTLRGHPVSFKNISTVLARVELLLAPCCLHYTNPKPLIIEQKPTSMQPLPKPIQVVLPAIEVSQPAITMKYYPTSSCNYVQNVYITSK